MKTRNIINNEILKIVKKLPQIFSDVKLSYNGFRKKILKKINYKISNDYIFWDEIVDEICLSLIDYSQSLAIKKDMEEKDDYVKMDRHMMMKHNYLCTLNKWLSTDSPVFLVENEILEFFLKSRIDLLNEDFFIKLFSNLDDCFKNILFLFPKNSLYHYDNEDKNGEELGYIDYCFVSFMKSESDQSVVDKINDLKNNTNDKKIKNLELETISINTKSFNSRLVCGNILLPSIDKQINKFSFDDNNKMLKDCNLYNVIIQCLLLISSKPNLLLYKNNNKIFSSSISASLKYKSENRFYPRVLNLDYVEKTVRSDDKAGKAGRGSQSPKRPHWRLGYEVNKPIGKMKGVPKDEWERKLIKVKPYLVRGNADLTSDD